MTRAELKTARLILRPLRPEDAVSIADGMGNWDVTRWLTAPPWPYDLGAAQDFLASPASGEALAIEIGGRLAGVVGRHLVREGGGGLELGYWLAQDFWGRGYMTEAAGAAVDDHFAQNDTPLQSGYILGNARSAHVLTKLGFRNTVTLPRKARPLGQTVTVQRMDLTAQDHIARKGWSARSPRLTYRPLWAADASALHGIVSHEHVVRQLYSWPWPPDRDFTLTRAAPFQGDGFAWGIFLDGGLIGTVAVTDGELGYFLAPEAWGLGFATEACRTALTHAFAGGRDNLTAGIWADNAASLNVLRKLGFKVTGEDVSWSKARQAETPGLLLRLDRADWPGA